MQEILRMRRIDKRFPGVLALNGVDFTLRKGEIHALMGENGAGKSTLIKVLTGVYQMDGGEIYLDDKKISITSPQDAQNNGISTVYQEITLCPNLTVAENMFIGRETSSWVQQGKYKKRADEILQKLGIPARSGQQLGNCSLAVQQMVAIARAVDMECKVLILDEPTSSLDDKEVQMLFDLMRNLRKEGVGIIFVTHFLEQVYEVSDRITVLRNGELVGEYLTQDLPQVELVAKMIGKELDELSSLREVDEAETEKKEVFFEAKGLTSSEALPFDFKIH
ncbi:MAG: sugar ABC transporter ATP-binding protein, partial [Lachnospiraceae bacterium]|nr:sugar ABC transporter ATP-binding protein [Lachnospiraceae bacterium]